MAYQVRRSNSTLKDTLYGYQVIRHELLKARMLYLDLTRPYEGGHDILTVERRNRITLSVAAYMYEYENNSWLSDREFDELALRIQPQMQTGNTLMDHFFLEEFSTDTGLWIHRHPELDKLKVYIPAARELARLKAISLP